MDDLRACEVLNACYERLFSAPLYASACKVYRRLKTNLSAHSAMRRPFVRAFAS